jgi:hypothetical protein
MRALRKLIERRSTGGDAVTSPERTAALALTTAAQRHLARGPDGFVRLMPRRGRSVTVYPPCYPHGLSAFSYRIVCRVPL